MEVQASKETSLSSSFLFANTGLEGGASMVSPVPGDVMINLFRKQGR